MEEKLYKKSDSELSETFEESWYHTEVLIRMFLRVIVGFSLLIGGLILLLSRLAGWSIIFGLPMVVFGSVFLIYTYDEVLSRKMSPHVDLGRYTNDKDEESEG